MDRPANADIPGPPDACRLDVDAATLELLQRSQREYGDVVRFHDPGRGTAIFINDGDLIRQVLVKQHKRYGKGRDFERVKMLLGNGIIVSDGDLWRRHRRMMQPAFSRTRIGDYVDIMQSSVRALQTQWLENNDAEVNISKTCSQFALEIILKSIFSDDLAALSSVDNNNPFEFLSEEFARDLRAVTQLRSARTKVLDLIQSRRTNKPPRNDFLQDLIVAEDREGLGLSDKEVVDEVMTLIVAGYETSAGTLNWAWFEIARHPEVGKRIADEFRSVSRASEALSAETISNLSYCRQVIAETLRLYPPVWLYSRRVAATDTIRGVALEPDTQIYLSPYLLHRHPSYWDAPERFRPERFADEIAEAAFIPFSLGPRRCIGEHFAYLEMQLHLSLLLSTFQPELTEPAHPGLHLGINLRSDAPVRVRLKRRG